LCLEGVGTIGQIIALGCGKKARNLIPLPDHFEHGATPSPLPNYRSPGLDSIQTDLGSV
jgi:hypothetical protein